MTSKTTSSLILASASPRRIELLRQINITPDQVIPADIDESALKNEKPKALALRLSQEKCRRVYQDHKEHFVLAADTVVACGQLSLDKAESAEQARKFLQKLSGRRHHVYGGITIISPAGKEHSISVDTLVQFKPLSTEDIKGYITSGEWEGKAGGYAIQGYAGTFVKYIAGSYSNVVGLSLYDTMKLLQRAGFTQ